MHRIICDENIPKRFVLLLRSLKFDVFYIAENCSGIEDLQICHLLSKSGGILLTQDKDFGELLFRLGTKINKGNVILIKDNIKEIQKQIIKNIRNLKHKDRQFLVITRDKIRIREI